MEPVLFGDDLIAVGLFDALLGEVLTSDVVRLQVLLLAYVREVEQLAVDLVAVTSILEGLRGTGRHQDGVSAQDSQ